MSLFYCSYHDGVEDSDAVGHIVVGFVESCNVGAGIASVPESAELPDAQRANRYMLAALRGVTTGKPASEYANVLSPDQYHAVEDVAKAIARLEGEQIAEQRAHEEKFQRMAADLAAAKREAALLTEIARCETEFAMAARTRADAAERRVEAVRGDAAEEAAYQVMVKEYGGRVLFSRLSIRLALEAALAAASGDTTTTEG